MLIPTSFSVYSFSPSLYFTWFSCIHPGVSCLPAYLSLLVAFPLFIIVISYYGYSYIVFCFFFCPSLMVSTLSFPPSLFLAFPLFLFIVLTPISFPVNSFSPSFYSLWLSCIPGLFPSLCFPFLSLLVAFPLFLFITVISSIPFILLSRWSVVH